MVADPDDGHAPLSARRARGSRRDALKNVWSAAGYPPPEFSSRRIGVARTRRQACDCAYDVQGWLQAVDEAGTPLARPRSPPAVAVEKGKAKGARLRHLRQGRDRGDRLPRRKERGRKALTVGEKLGHVPGASTGTITATAADGRRVLGDVARNFREDLRRYSPGTETAADALRVLDLNAVSPRPPPARAALDRQPRESASRKSSLPTLRKEAGGAVTKFSKGGQGGGGEMEIRTLARTRTSHAVESWSRRPRSTTSVTPEVAPGDVTGGDGSIESRDTSSRLSG